MSSFPWAAFETLTTWNDEYKYGDRSIENLNSIHLVASIWYAKLSTYVMEQNATNLEAKT